MAEQFVKMKHPESKADEPGLVPVRAVGAYKKKGWQVVKDAEVPTDGQPVDETAQPPSGDGVPDAGADAGSVDPDVTADDPSADASTDTSGNPDAGRAGRRLR